MRSRFLNGDSDHDVGLETGKLDTIMNALAVALMILMVIVIKVGEEKAKEDAVINSPGNVIVEISWPAERDVDLDLWIKGPGDKPVGYSSREGRVFNLLRDDLGKSNDSSDINMENAFSRGIHKGEYVVNVHYFGDHDRQGEIVCKARIMVAKGSNDKSTAAEILSTELTIKLGQEKTIFRFKLTEEGELVEDSVHHRYLPLRAAGGGGMRSEGVPFGVMGGGDQ